MADVHHLYKKFEENIKLNASAEESLRTSKAAIEERIKSDFSNKNRNEPTFFIQGSFKMRTTVNPLDGDYDLDNGTYLHGYDEYEEFPVASTVHRWVVDATNGYTEEEVIDKNTCVRVPYQKGYHIDLPIYIELDDTVYLAHKRDGWIESDPKAVVKWFQEFVKKNGEQARSVLKYLKAWKDYTKSKIKGIELTFLLENNFVSWENSDDKSILNTVQNIVNGLEKNIVCLNPIDTSEDLFTRYDSNEKQKILEGFKSYLKSLTDADLMLDEHDASVELRKMYGDRFPLGEKRERDKTSSPGVLRSDGRSAKESRKNFFIE